MNKERLLKVAQALRESPKPSEFTMERFGQDCGTPCCALGHYAFRKDLQSEFCLTSTGNVGAVGGSKRTLWIDSEQIMRHFDITIGQSQDLFGDDGCDCASTPEMAAEYIERFVAEAM